MIKSRIFLYMLYLSAPVAASIHYSIHPRSYLWNLLFPVFAGGAAVMLSRGFRKPVYRLLTAFLFCFSIFMFEFFEFLSYYLQGESFNARYFFHVGPDTMIVGAKAYPRQAGAPFVVTLILLVIDILLCRKGSGKKTRMIPWLAVATLSLLFLPNSPKSFFVAHRQFTKPVVLQTEEDFASELKKYNVNVEAFRPGDYGASAARESKNLVLLYLESLERAYLDESIFPDLTPNIQRAIETGLEWTDVQHNHYASWTIAGIFASQCATPMMVMGNDAFYQSHYVKNMVCVGDVLHKAGYRQVYMGGAPLSFAGKGDYLKGHGYDEVYGYEELKGHVEKTGYEKPWGLYDDTLLDLAAEKYHELAKKKERFALTVLTIDTHHPDGAASGSCPEYPLSDNSMLQAVHCTDFLFEKFMESIRGSDAFDNTLIFVMSDHLAMINTVWDLYPEERKNLVFALNAGQTGKIDMAALHYDIPHTILDLLDIRTDVTFPFGQSLLEEEQRDRFDLFLTGNAGILQQLLAQYDKKSYSRTFLGDGVFIKDTPNSVITIGGTDIVMSHLGKPILPVDLIFLVQCSLNGRLESYVMVDETEAIQRIEASPESLYFMLTQRASLPYVDSGPGKNGAWRWHLGCPSSLGGETRALKSLTDLKISREECRKIIAESADVSREIFDSKKKRVKTVDGLSTKLFESKRRVRWRLGGSFADRTLNK